MWDYSRLEKKNCNDIEVAAYILEIFVTRLRIAVKHTASFKLAEWNHGHMKNSLESRALWLRKRFYCHAIHITESFRSLVLILSSASNESMTP